MTQREAKELLTLQGIQLSFPNHGPPLASCQTRGEAVLPANMADAQGGAEGPGPGGRPLLPDFPVSEVTLPTLCWGQ